MNLNCLGEVAYLYNKAESAIKQYERVALEERAVVLDNLRESAHAVWEVLNLPDGSGELPSVLAAAKESCEKAIVAAMEGAVTYLMQEVDSFWDNKFSRDELKAVIPDYRAVYDQIGEIRKRWRDDADRHEISIEQMDSDFNELKRIRAKMDEALPRLKDMKYVRERACSARLQSKYDKIRDNVRRKIQCEFHKVAAMDYIAIVLSAFGILLTIIQEQHNRMGMILMLSFVAGSLIILRCLCNKFKICCCKVSHSRL